ncbi:MAG: S8 family peptidase [Lachnospiraceae bacterium]|nr:S8 family peptidase [Lachnospiraceae bacterium]
MDCRTRIMSDDYADIMVDFDLEVNNLVNTAGDFCFYQIEDNLRIFYVKRDELPDLSLSDYRYLYLPACYGLMQSRTAVGEAVFNTNALEESGILSVQREPLALTGIGCVMAVIDSGIDYSNPVFRRRDGSSRILAIWDQEEQSGTPPAGFLYGSEYDNAQINEALQSNNSLEIVPTADIPGKHGTALASIAAGSSLDEGTTFLGAAPDADIVVVKLKQAKPYLRKYYLIPEETPCYQETDILTALKYVIGYAQTFQRPVCICLGIGTSFGDHAGNSLLERYINRINTLRNVAVILPAGNEGNARHHFRAAFDGEDVINERMAEIRVGEENKGFIAEIWGSVPSFFRISLRSPGGEEVRDISFRLNNTRIYDFIYSDTKVYVDALLVEQISGQQLVVMRFENPTPGIWTVGIGLENKGVPAICDMWLPIQQFLTGDVYFLEPNPYTTLTMPATGGSAICVSAYNPSGGGFYQDSGRGFTRSGIIKPDISAPGVNIPSIIGEIDGTGAAAALTAGAALQFMQWAVVEKNRPLVNGVELKNYFIRGARRDAGLNWPNREQGYGQLDINGTFDALRNV